MDSPLTYLAVFSIAFVAPENLESGNNNDTQPNGGYLAQSNGSERSEDIDRLRRMAITYEAERRELLKEMEDRKTAAKEAFKKEMRCKAMASLMTGAGGKEKSFEAIEYFAENCASFEVQPTSSEVKENIERSKKKSQ